MITEQTYPELPPEAPADIEPYLPEELGLDPNDPKDLQLYVDSQGDWESAQILLERRDLAGQIAGSYALGSHERFIAEGGLDSLEWQLQARNLEIRRRRLERQPR